MKPILTYRPLSEFSRERKRALCKCTVRCEQAVLIVLDDFAYHVCEKGTAEFAYELLKLSGQLSETLKSPGSVWTTLETMELKDYILGFQGRVPYGGLAAFAKKKNKTREQVKCKVTYLKKMGMIPYVNARD